jgi:hypothetical protein
MKSKGKKKGKEELPSHSHFLNSGLGRPGGGLTLGIGHSSISGNYPNRKVKTQIKTFIDIHLYNNSFNDHKTHKNEILFQM